MDVTAMAQLFIPGVGAEAGVAKGSGSLNQGPSAPQGMDMCWATAC